MGDEVRDDLRVGLARELRAHVGQPDLQREVVLDDAVDHDVHAVGGVEVRVGVGLVDAPVGGPARVADASRADARGDGDAALAVDRSCASIAALRLSRLPTARTDSISPSAPITEMPAES